MTTPFETLADQHLVLQTEMPDPPLWMQNAIYPAGVDRSLVTATLPPGVLSNELVVGPRALGADMSVDVAAGRCVVAGTDVPDQGHYLCTSHEVVNLPVASRPGRGSHASTRSSRSTTVRSPGTRTPTAGRSRS